MRDLNLPALDGCTRIIVLRHTEPDEQITGRCYGSLDVPLSPRGHQHARHLASTLDAVIDTVISSPRIRASATAAAIACPRELPVLTDPRLRELDFGEFEGATYAAIEADHPAFWQQWMEMPTSVHFPGGEGHADLKRRVLNCVQDIRTRHAGQTTLLVTHGGVARTILAQALNMADADLFHIDQHHGALNVIDWFAEFPVVRLLNG